VPTELPNNNSSIQVTALRDGRLAMVFNESSAEGVTERRLSLYDDIEDDDAPGTGGTATAPAVGQAQGRKTFWGAPRAPLTLALSSDGGITWPARRNLEVGDGYCMTNNSKEGLNREFSYPSITQTEDGNLHVAFTYFRQAIKYSRVSPGWVNGGQ
jgi:predicted neuraminidase